MKVLVLVEEHNASLKRSSCEVITDANQLTSPDKITAIALNASDSALKSAGKYGVNSVGVYAISFEIFCGVFF